MNAEDLIEAHRAKTIRLRDKEYREHYSVIKEAVQQGVPLWSAVAILREQSNAFPGRRHQAIWQAYRRALKHDGIILSELK